MNIPITHNLRVPIIHNLIVRVRRNIIEISLKPHPDMNVPIIHNLTVRKSVLLTLFFFIQSEGFLFTDVQASNVYLDNLDLGNPWIWNNGKPLYLLEWLQLPRLSPTSLLFQFDGQLGQCFLKLFSCFETFLKQIETNYNILKCVSLFFISSFFGLHFVIENLIFKGSAHNRSMRLLNSSVAINIEQPVTVYQFISFSFLSINQRAQFIIPYQPIRELQQRFVSNRMHCELYFVQSET